MIPLAAILSIGEKVLDKFARPRGQSQSAGQSYGDGADGVS
jgi:hypothetical protein